MKRLSRSNALKLAAVLSLLLGIGSLVVFAPLLERGASSLDLGIDTPPYPVIVMSVIGAVVRLVSAYGVWFGQRWAVILILLFSALDGAAAAPGLLFAPTDSMWAMAIAAVMWNVAIVVLCLWRDHKPVST